MALKGVFIDAGHTLLYEMPSRAAIYADAAGRAGLRVAPAEMARLMEAAHEELARELAGAFRYSDEWFGTYMRRIFQHELGLSDAALHPLQRELFERFSDPATFRLYPGAHELLEGISELDLCVGVLSNWGPRLPRLLEGLGVADRLDFVLVSALERCEKPEREFFERALRRAELAPDEALHAGDHPERDVAGARRAGIEGVLVDHAGRHALSEVPAVRSLPELLELVRERAT